MMKRLPFFTPLGWSVIFLAGAGIGAWIAVQMLIIRGLW
jgi:hypothetical protein